MSQTDPAAFGLPDGDMTDPDGTDLSALVGSRICHDLISPLGAISNGLELLQMSGVGNSPELELIRDSIETANARVRLFRIAFGAASAQQRVDWPEVSQAIAGISDRRLAVDWPATPAMSRAEARLAVLLLMCAESMMPRGGSVLVGMDPICVRMTAERFRAEPSFLLPLTEEVPEVIASAVHFAFARRAADDLGRRIAIEADNSTMTLTALSYRRT